MFTTRQTDGGVGLRRRLAALITHLDGNVDQEQVVFLPLAVDLAGEVLNIALVVELSDLVVLAHHKGTVTHPVGDEVVDPAFAEYAVVVCAGITNRFGPLGIPMHTLGDVR